MRGEDSHRERGLYGGGRLKQRGGRPTVRGEDSHRERRVAKGKGKDSHREEGG